jgi:hypothetical protein
MVQGDGERRVKLRKTIMLSVMECKRLFTFMVEKKMLSLLFHKFFSHVQHLQSNIMSIAN